VKRVEWTETALKGLASVDKTNARRIKQAVDRFVQTTAGDVKKLQGIDPPEYHLRVGDYRVRFEQDNEAIPILRVRDRKDAYR
jgi:mRNA-degrading endonuclease RelE of RelBE toxin-antitoxin system